MNRVTILLALACAAASVAAADKQQVYKWTDANGVVHFSDAPPPKDTQNVQSVHLVGGTTSATADDQPKEPAANPDAPAGAPAATPPSDDATLCKQAHANLELLQGKTPVGIAGPDGKAQVLDDKSREAQIANARRTISRFCK